MKSFCWPNCVQMLRIAFIGGHLLQIFSNAFYIVQNGGLKFKGYNSMSEPCTKEEVKSKV